MLPNEIPGFVKTIKRLFKRLFISSFFKIMMNNNYIRHETDFLFLREIKWNKIAFPNLLYPSHSVRIQTPEFHKQVNIYIISIFFFIPF